MRKWMVHTFTTTVIAEVSTLCLCHGDGLTFYIPTHLDLYNHRTSMFNTEQVQKMHTVCQCAVDTPAIVMYSKMSSSSNSSRRRGILT